MIKIVKIGEKEYSMKSSAYTQFAYKNETGRSFLKDIQSLTTLAEKGEEYESLEQLTELLLKVAFVMIKESNEKQVSDYESFLKSIDNIYDDQTWIEEVVKLACSPISRQLQDN